MNLPKLRQDFGVRALLAMITVIAFEGLLATVLIILAIKGQLNIQGAMGILALGQAPAMSALAWYFTKQSANKDTTL